MNTPLDQSGSHAKDDVVSAIYRQAADERVPDQLNDTILRSARKVAATSGAKAWRLDWLQPIALVAVIGLSLTFVLDSGDLTMTNGQTPAMEQGSNALDNAADAALEQIRAAESFAQRNPGVTDSATPPVMIDAGNPESLAPSEDPRCSAAQRSTTKLWWQCIQTLERGGHTEAATIEYEALSRRIRRLKRLKSIGVFMRYAPRMAWRAKQS